MRLAIVALLAACSERAGSGVHDAGVDALRREGPCEVTQVPSCPDGSPARVLEVFPSDGSTCGALGGTRTNCPADPEAAGVASCSGVTFPRSTPCGLRMETFVKKPGTSRATCTWSNIEPAATAVILHVTDLTGYGAELLGLGNPAGRPSRGWVRMSAGTSGVFYERSDDGLTWTTVEGVPSGAEASTLSLDVYVGLGMNQPTLYAYAAIELAEAVFVCP